MNANRSMIVAGCWERYAVNTTTVLTILVLSRYRQSATTPDTSQSPALTATKGLIPAIAEILAPAAALRQKETPKALLAFAGWRITPVGPVGEPPSTVSPSCHI